MAELATMDFRQFARSVGTVMDYAPGDVVFREGDPSRSMYVVLQGEVDISSHGKTLETIHAGDAMGIVALLDEQPRTATARAIGPCQVAMIDRRKFRYMIEEMPNFAWYVMGELAHRLRSTNAHL